MFLLLMVFFLQGLVFAQQNESGRDSVTESVFVERTPDIGLDRAKSLPGYVIEIGRAHV